MAQVNLPPKYVIVLNGRQYCWFNEVPGGGAQTQVTDSKSLAIVTRDFLRARAPGHEYEAHEITLGVKLP